MRLSALITVFSLAFLLASARAQSGPDDQYVAIYGLMEQADSLAAAGQPRLALTEYQQALNQLETFQKGYPTWSPNIVNFRLSYLADKISAMAALLPGGTVAPTNPAPALPPAVNPAAGLASQVTDLQAQVQNLQGVNSVLADKLKEALTVQPAAADPRELAAAQEKVRQLMKENDLLRVSLIKGKTPAEAGVMLVDSNALARAQRQLADLDKKLALEVRLAGQFSDDNKALQEQLKTLQASSAGVQALRDENTLLKKQLAEAKAIAKKTKSNARLQADLEKAQAQVDSLQKAARLSALEKVALEKRVKELELAAAVSAKTPVLADQSENLARIHALEKERDALQTQLSTATKKSGSGKKSRSEVVAQIDQLTAQVTTLQARIAVDEAQPVPYTSEELALFRQTPPAPVEAADGAKSIQELSGGSAQLAASAHAHFAAGQYDQAAGDYQKILAHDENNGLVLANLAAIELQQGHLADAEKHIVAAVSLSPDNAFNLSILGNLKFQQGKLDEALDILSKAAKLDPQSPQIENYLGFTLGQKGLRLQAETALRKALLLDPDFAAAHNNLAVVYISENPPRAELARWHYLKALAAGQPHNPGLEKLLSDNGAAIPAQ